MLRLIFVEFIKILHKRSIYILLLLMTLFCFLNNYLYDKDYDDEGFYRYGSSLENLDSEEKRLCKELLTYDVDVESDVIKYISLKSQIDIIRLKKKFSFKSWQYQYMEYYLYDTLYERNMYLDVLHDDVKFENIEHNYQEMISRLEGDDWKYFVSLELESLLKDIESQSREDDIYQKKLRIDELRYRLVYSVRMEEGYLNQALLDFKNAKSTLHEMRDYRELDFNMKKNYQDAFSKMKISEYILENRVNIQKENTTQYLLRTISLDYEIFLILIILMVSSTIICDEFHKGTVKLLLIKPYSRGKILFSKYCVCLLIFLFSLFFLILMQLLFGYIFFGGSSLKLPVVVYHFSYHQIIEYSIWKYMLIRFISRFPFFLMMLTICFTLSVVFTSTVVSIMIPMLLYLFFPVVMKLGVKYQFGWFQYFLPIQVHFENYLFGGIGEYPFVSFRVLIILFILYYLLLMCISFFCFKKKDIRNI